MARRLAGELVVRACVVDRIIEQSIQIRDARFGACHETELVHRRGRRVAPHARQIRARCRISAWRLFAPLGAPDYQDTERCAQEAFIIVSSTRDSARASRPARHYFRISISDF